MTYTIMGGIQQDRSGQSFVKFWKRIYLIRLPINIKQTCALATTEERLKCEDHAWMRNLIFAALVSLLGISSLLLFAFTVNRMMKRRRARRHTKPHDAPLMSEQECENIKAPWKGAGANDPEGGGQQDTMEVPGIRRLDLSHGDTAVNSATTTMDGVNDGWTVWIRGKEGPKLNPIPRHSPMALPRSFAPHIPSLTLPNPTFATVRRVGGHCTVRLLAQKTEVKESRRTTIRWASSA